MLQRISTACQRATWQRELAEAIRDPAELLAILNLPVTLLAGTRAASREFPLRVPHGFVARMHKSDVNDPLLRQVLPLAAEFDNPPGFDNDPVGDLAATTEKGVLHKYHGRGLAVATGACGVHCRYCFRRHFPYRYNNAGVDGWESLLTYIQQDDTITEVILSGGDPLTISDRRLAGFTQRLASIPRVKRLRIHSRLPIVIPSRIDDDLLDWIGNARLQVVIVLHANHANEIDHEVGAAARRLRDIGVTLLNQSVLLKGVNDSVTVLARLSETLFEIGILPYYLHLLDRVRGAAHFEVEEPLAVDLITALRRLLPGYLVPRLVREIDGRPAKFIVK